MEINNYFSEVEQMWNKIHLKVQKWQNIDALELKKKPAKDKWSALECLDHLNQTYKIYIPNLEKALSKQKENPAKKFKPGLLGNIMVNSVGVKDNGKAKMPMKTFDFFEPGLSDSLNKDEVFSQFLEYHQKFQEIIQKSKELNINKVKVQSALSWLKLRLGVSFLFLLNHELRHIAQGERAMNNS